MDLEKRIKMAAESIMENESLRDGLDDDVASALLDWGIARAKQIASETADIEDDEEAQEASYPRMRGLRKILRNAASLCVEDLDPSTHDELLQEIADRIPDVYGPDAPSPDLSSWAMYLAAPAESKAQKIIGFRALLEENLNSGEENAN
jgi:hypothetical protein